MPYYRQKQLYCQQLTYAIFQSETILLLAVARGGALRALKRMKVAATTRLEYIRIAPPKRTLIVRKWIELEAMCIYGFIYCTMDL